MRPWSVWKELSLVWTNALSCVTTCHRDLECRRAAEEHEEQDDDVKLAFDEDINSLTIVLGRVLGGTAALSEFHCLRCHWSLLGVVCI